MAGRAGFRRRPLRGARSRTIRTGFAPNNIDLLGTAENRFLKRQRQPGGYIIAGNRAGTAPLTAETASAEKAAENIADIAKIDRTLAVSGAARTAAV